MLTHEQVAKRRVAAVAALTLAAALLAMVPAAAQPRERASEDHCVAVAADVTADGGLVLDEPACFATPEEAEAAAEAVLGDLAESNEVVAGSVLAGDPGGLSSAMSASKTLGIHYDGTNGTGSSITVVGSACAGGYWNASATWKNRISSTYNGCARLKHYDMPSKVGSTYTTLGVGDTDNLGWFSNMTESVSYHSS